MPTQNPSYIDPYDNRIGSGGLPSGIVGSENRAYTYTPQASQTSHGLLNQYTQNSSPMMANARTRANEFSARRGLLNSSIAAGNAERSAIESAGQFALNDSGLINSAMLKNVDVLNDREAQRAAEQMQNNMSSLVNQNAEAQRQAERESQLQLQRERLGYEGEQNQLDRVTGADMARMGYGFDVGLANLGAYNQRQIMGDEYGYDIGRENNSSRNQYNNASRLADQNAYNESGLSNQQFRQNLFMQLAADSFQNAEIFGDPEGMNNVIGYFMNSGPNGRPAFLDNNSYFRSRSRRGG